MRNRSKRNWSRAAYKYAAKLLLNGVGLDQTAEVMTQLLGQKVPRCDIVARISKGALPHPTRRLSQVAINAILDSEVAK